MRNASVAVITVSVPDIKPRRLPIVVNVIVTIFSFLALVTRGRDARGCIVSKREHKFGLIKFTQLDRGYQRLTGWYESVINIML